MIAGLNGPARVAGDRFRRTGGLPRRAIPQAWRRGSFDLLRGGAPWRGGAASRILRLDGASGQNSFRSKDLDTTVRLSVE
jgi:hypothetical protein